MAKAVTATTVPTPLCDNEFAGGTGIGLKADIKKVFVLFPTDMTLIPATSAATSSKISSITSDKAVALVLLQLGNSLVTAFWEK